MEEQRALKFSGIFMAPRAMPIGNRTISELAIGFLNERYGRKNGETNLIGDGVRSREIRDKSDRAIRSDPAKYC